MPTYQYSCTECGHTFETFQSFSDDSLTECPDCGGRLRKVFNAVGVVFKGSGFYRNDSRTAPDKSSDKSSDKGRERGDKGPDKKADKSGENAPKETAKSPDKPPDKSSNGTKSPSERSTRSSS